jgi:hypothetical protein
VTGIFPFTENNFGEGKFLSTYVTDRTYNQVKNQSKNLQVPRKRWTKKNRGKNPWEEKDPNKHTRED